MTTPLLATKLYIPPLRPDLVPRLRLTRRLDEGLRLDHRLTLVSAPAGFGKTTLLSEWANGCERPVAWVSLDEGDNDPARFLAYFVAALQAVEKNIGEGTLDALQSPQPSPTASASGKWVEELLTALINQISTVPHDFALVLDDYHLITSQPIHQALIFLLDHLPGNMHLTIATRSDPPLHLARLRGRGQLTELRQTDLRFTSDEATAFLYQAMGLNLTPENVAALEARTEGWIVGLQLAAISMRGLRDTAGFVEAFTGSHRYILDYLADEVLQQQPEAIRTFLLQTSILNRLSAPLCDALTDRDDGQEILDQLENDNLFIVPLDHERRWYRYHRLFADLLCQRLQRTQPDTVPALHRRASAWYEYNGLMVEAIGHTLSARDFERAACLINEHVEALWGEGAQTTLSRWLEALPDELVCSRPRLCIFHAFSLFLAGQLHAAEGRLRAADRALDSITELDEHNRVEQQGMVAALRAYVALFQGDVPAIIQFSDRALGQLPDENVMWRGMVAIVLGDAHAWSGDMVAANRAYAEAVRMSQAAGNVYLILFANSKLVTNQWRQGRLRRVVEICREQLQLADERGFSQTARAGGFLLLWGEVLCEWNKLEEAMHYVQKGLELGEQGDNVAVLGFGYLSLARVLFAKGDLAGVKETIHKLERLARESDLPIWITNAIVAWKAGIWITQGNLEAAAGLFQERGLSVDDDFTYLREVEYLSLVRLLIARASSRGAARGGKLEKAMRLLERLRQAAEAGGRVGWVVVALALRALALQAQGDINQAVATLEKALTLAEPEGYIRTFVDEGEPMAELLSRAASQGIAPKYVSQLLAAFGVSEYGSMGGTPPRLHTQPLIEPLSDRELEVLRLLATHLSSPEIAEELFVSVNTVRSHIKSIYGKLNVHRRMDAIQRAKELDLL